MSQQKIRQIVQLSSDFSMEFSRTQKPKIPLSYRHGATLSRVVVADELDMSLQSLENWVSEMKCQGTPLPFVRYIKGTKWVVVTELFHKWLAGGLDCNPGEERQDLPQDEPPKRSRGRPPKLNS